MSTPVERQSEHLSRERMATNIPSFPNNKETPCSVKFAIALKTITQWEVSGRPIKPSENVPGISTQNEKCSGVETRLLSG